jgi:putative ABC transport system permease protein
VSRPGLIARLRTLVTRRRRLGEYDAEVSAHLDLMIADLERTGMSPDDAQREARRRFGGIDQAREQFRDASGFPSLDELAADVRYSLRMIRRQPGFALIVVLLVAIGVGANTAIFSLVNAILLRPLAYPSADRLVVVRTSIPAMTRSYPSVPAAAGEFLLWQSRVTAFDSIAAVKAETQTLTGNGDASRVEVVRVTSELLPMLGAQPAVGRVFRTDEDREGRDAVAMLTYQSWQQRFGGDRGVVGRSITLDGRPYAVVGVLPADFRYPRNDQLGALVGLPDHLDVLRPAAFVADERENLAGDFDWAVIGRLRHGATLAQADAQANAVTTEIAKKYGDKLQLLAQLTPLHEQIVQQSRRGILLLGWSVAAVLLVLVVNLANLLLSRVSTRTHEAAVRAALGAGRVRVARQLVIENLLLAGAGGLAGLLLASAALQVLAANAPDGLARLDEVRLDGVVLLFGLGVSLAAGLLFSVLPAWRLAGSSPQVALRGSARSVSMGTSAMRTQNLLVTAEVALSTVLLAASALLVASFARLLTVDTGLSTARVVFANLSASVTRYPEDAARAALYDRLLASLRQIPGVSSASLVSEPPLHGEAHVRTFSVDHETRALDERPVVNIRFVDAGYFSSVGIALKRGRLFDDRDRGRHVIVVNERTAQATWPDQDPLGRLCRQGNDNHPLLEVIGVVGDTREVSLYKSPYLMAYVPYWSEETPASVTMVLKTDLPVDAVTPLVRNAIRDVEPEIPVPLVQSFSQAVDRAVAPDRFQLMLVSGFAIAAMMLAALGVYGVPAFAVSRRSQELGIRLALGAAPRSLVRLVIAQSLAPVLMGIAIGFVGAVAASRFLQSLLFEARGVEWGALVAVSIAVAGIALVACYIPARRVIGIDPTVAIRGIGE